MVPPSSAYGIATTRSSSWSGISLAACSATPVSGRSMNGSWKRLASVRARPSAVATPPSRTACADEPPRLTRPRSARGGPPSGARGGGGGERGARDGARGLDQIGDELRDLVDRKALGQAGLPAD